MGLLALLLIGLAASDRGVAVTGIGLPDEQVLPKGKTVTLEPEFFTNRETSPERLEEAADRLELAWRSSDLSVVSVDRDGVVTGLGKGTAAVTVTAEGSDLKATTQVEVRIPASCIQAKDVVLTTLDKTVPLTYKLVPTDAQDDVKVTVDGDCVAMENDTLMVKGAGHAELTLQAGEAETTMTVTVRQAPAELSLKNMTLNPGKKVNLPVATGLKKGVSPEIGTKFTFVSDNEKVASVDDKGKLTAKAVGKATITVKNELNQTASAVIRVAEEQTATPSIAPGQPAQPTTTPEAANPTPTATPTARPTSTPTPKPQPTASPVPVEQEKNADVQDTQKETPAATDVTTEASAIPS